VFHLNGQFYFQGIMYAGVGFGCGIIGQGIANMIMTAKRYGFLSSVSLHSLHDLHTMCFPCSDSLRCSLVPSDVGFFFSFPIIYLTTRSARLLVTLAFQHSL